MHIGISTSIPERLSRASKETDKNRDLAEHLQKDISLPASVERRSVCLIKSRFDRAEQFKTFGCESFKDVIERPREIRDLDKRVVLTKTSLPAARHSRRMEIAQD